jgi:hypothetical protein
MVGQTLPQPEFGADLVGDGVGAGQRRLADLGLEWAQ